LLFFASVTRMPPYADDGAFLLPHASRQHCRCCFARCAPLKVPPASLFDRCHARDFDAALISFISPPPPLRCA